MTEQWVRTYKWCPFGERLPNPKRALVEIGHLDETDHFVPERAHLLVDVTDERNPKIEVSLADLPAERKEAYRHWGGGWEFSVESMPAWMREEYRV